MCGNTNGRMAYLLAVEVWPMGGYEVENSPFGKNAAEHLQKKIIATLKRPSADSLLFQEP